MTRSIQARGTSVLLALALSTGLTGCASLGAEQEPEGLAQQVASLRATVVALQQKNTVTELELQRLRVQVAELELARTATDRGRQGTEPAPIASAQPTLPVTQTGPEDPIQPDPRGKIVITDLEPEPVPSAPAERPEPEQVSGSESSSPFTPTSPVRTTTGVLTPEAQALYDEGYTQYNRRQFVAAETTFQRFLQQFDNTSLADNAQYWIAESRYSRGDGRGALAAFRETVARYPKGNKAPDALLRAGRVFEELGDENAALESYRELVRLFPESADALLAEDRIKALLGG